VLLQVATPSEIIIPWNSFLLVLLAMEHRLAGLPTVGNYPRRAMEHRLRRAGSLVLFFFYSG
jgi:hypothetical protein